VGHALAKDDVEGVKKNIAEAGEESTEFGLLRLDQGPQESKHVHIWSEEGASKQISSFTCLLGAACVLLRDRLYRTDDSGAEGAMIVDSHSTQR